MKRCPECRRDYYDDTLLYCLDDGSALLDGPASFGGGRTEMLPAFGVVGEAGTLAFDLATASPSPDENSIAVLPFSNLSGDAGNDYFCDGISEELLNALAKIRGLRVAARTSAFSFKGRPTTIAEIGSTLGVASVLEGSVRIAGSRIRISVQLEDTANGYQLWSDSYNRTFDDIFAVQDDIAASVVAELRTRLTVEPVAEARESIVSEVAEAFKGRATDPEAQRLLLLGRYFLDRTNREDAEKAIIHFRKAVEVDDQFALGWAELGHAYCVMAGKNWQPLDESYGLAREAVERALAIEPELAEAHAHLGRIKAAYDLDLTGAAESYDKALRLSPGNSVVADGASILELKLGHLDKAMGLSRGVVDQDPLSAAVWHNLGLICACAGRPHEAEQAFRRALELSPGRLVTNAMLAVVLLEEGREEAALIQSFSEPDEFWGNWSRAIINYKTGNKSEADSLLGHLIDTYTYGDAFQIAEIYAVRGESDKAFEWLDRSFLERDPGITHTKASPHFRSLRNDARWREFLVRIGLNSDY